MIKFDFEAIWCSVHFQALGHSAHLMGYFLGIFGGMKNLSPPPKEKLSAV